MTVLDGSAQLPAHLKPPAPHPTPSPSPSPSLCRCMFRGCQHLQEPGCVVREAGWERYPLYAEIHAELKALEEVQAQRQAK